MSGALTLTKVAANTPQLLSHLQGVNEKIHFKSALRAQISHRALYCHAMREASLYVGITCNRQRVPFKLNEFSVAEPLIGACHPC